MVLKSLIQGEVVSDNHYVRLTRIMLEVPYREEGCKQLSIEGTIPLLSEEQKNARGYWYWCRTAPAAVLDASTMRDSEALGMGLHVS